MPQFERPERAQSWSRVMPPKICVSANAPTNKKTITISPTTAERRDVGSSGPSFSSGSHRSGFLTLWYLRNA
jgi:hypothetical protein